MSRNKVAMAAAGGAYISAAYISYLYFTADKRSSKIENPSERGEGSCACNSFSYVADPNRTNTFQKIAYAYDDEISKDELVMGVNLLRRWMLYHHAKGGILEVGAGTGRNVDYYPNPTSLLQKLSWGQSGAGNDEKITKIVLSDTSDKMLQHAKYKIATKSSEHQAIFEVKEADAANLHMYENNSFDTIVDTFGLCSFNDPVAVLKELQRVCKPDGKILLLEHGRTKTYETLSKYLDVNAERHAKNWGCVWNRDIDEILEQAGLRVESLYTWHFGTTYYVVCRPGYISSSSIESVKDDNVLNKVETESAAVNVEVMEEEKIARKGWRQRIGGLWSRKKDN